MGTGLCFAPATELARRIRRGELSPVAVVEAHIERIEARDDEINAYVDLYPEEAREDARRAERAVADGDALGPLHGLPVAVKDNYAVAGRQLTMGATPLASNVAVEDEAVVAAVRAAGGIVLGKTNLPAFATKAITDNDLFGPTGTPFDPDRTAGGSSGGSAAAVAAGMAPLALATDGGGSARIPASACGVFGMKPSFGRVPIAARPDGFAHHTPMRGRGPLARTVADGALLLDVMASVHPRDPFSVPSADVDYRAAVDRPIDDLSVGFTPDLGVFPVDARVREITGVAADRLAEAGATVRRIEPDLDHTLEELQDVYFTGGDVGMAELYENLRETRGIDLLADHVDALDEHNLAAIRKGLETSAVAYRRADVVRTALFDAVQDLFESVDLLALPTLACPPFEHGSWGPGSVDGQAVDPLSGWVLTWPFNMTGHPASSVPAGFTDGGLPVGLQLVGERFADGTVLAASAALERVSPWADAYPPGGSAD